jgi:hypothetical protein
MNLSDGVVIAVDSATTMFSGPGAISKVFLDADKLFQLGTSKIGVATYGVASLHGRTIGSFIREFVRANADLPTMPIGDVCERLRGFMLDYYRTFSEQIHGLPFDQIPSNMKGILGLVVAGFSPNTFQSEVWEIQIPVNETPGSAMRRNAPGSFGLSWYAASMPINRYIKGLDPEMSVKIRTLFETILGRGLTPQEQQQFQVILNEHEYHINYDGLPIKIGIACAKFLVDFVIGHYTFAETHPIVGGRAKIGIVTYSHDAFTLLD